MEVDANRTPQPLQATRRIPSEIWLKIMESLLPEEFLETTVPHPFSTSAGTTTTPPWDFVDLIGLRLTLRTLHALVLTDRFFYGLALPLLYEVVVVETDSAARCLYSTLVENPALSHLALRTHHLVLTALIPAAFPYVTPLIQSMKSIRALSVRPIEIAIDDGECITWPQEFVSALKEASGHSLRKIHLDYNASVFISPPRLTYLLSFTPQLQTLIIRDPALGGSLTLPRLDCLSFLHAQAGIQTTFQTDESIPPFPSLSHLLIEPVWWTHDRSDFLKRQGPLLTGVTLDLTEFAHPHWVIPKLRLLWHLAPSVTQIEVVLRWGQSFTLAPLPPSATHVSLWHDSPPPVLKDEDKAYSEWAEHLLEVLHRIGENESTEQQDLIYSLQVVRLMKLMQTRLLQRFLDRVSGGKLCTAQLGPLRVEGPTGELFPCFVTDLDMKES